MITAEAATVGLFVAMAGIAAISGWLILVSVSEGAAGSAWLGAVFFFGSLLVAAFYFWRLL